MRGAKRSAKNTAKNISLLVLCGLMGVLCAVNWLMGLNVAQMPADSALRRLHDRFVGGAVGYEIRSSGVSAADPAQMALTVDGKLYGVQYNLTDIDAGITATRSLWSQALTGEGLRPADESELCTALRSGSCALLRYHGAIPMQSIAGWLGGSWKDNDRLQVETLVYAAGVQRLFVRMADGRLYAADAAVSQNALEEAQKNFRGLSCSFAGDAYAVYPETLLFDSEALSLPVLKPAQINLFAAQSGTGLEDLLGAFGYTAYTDFYNEQDGTVRVFLDDTSTLRLNASGLVQYASTDGSATVSAYDESDITDAAALDAQLDCARLILDAAQRAGDTDTHASLYAVERSGEQTTLIFLQMYSGVPVLGDADFATFVFDGNALRTATIRLQKFQPTGGKRTVMPAKQAAAGASGAERGLMAAYRAQDGQYVPSRFYLKNATE